MWQLGLAYLGPQYAVQLLGGGFFLHRAGIVFWRRRYFDRQLLMKVAQDCMQMSIYQAAYAVASQSDLLLIGLINGAGMATAYGIAQRLFSLVLMVAATVGYAQWPVFARADAANDMHWVKRVYYRTCFLGGISVVGVCALVNIFYGQLTHFWLHQDIVT